MRINLNRRVRRAAATGAALAALSGIGMATADSAAAATHKNGVHEVGELGLYYLDSFRPPVLDLYYPDACFADDYFPGTWIPADDNTRSVWNRDSYTWFVYTGCNFSGSAAYVTPDAAGNLTSIFRDTVSSARF